MAKINQAGAFQSALTDEIANFQKNIHSGIIEEDCLRIDLHCHDFNSNVPDELLGRILKVPETWLKTNDLLNTLHKNNCNAITVTNHNNARSCFSLLEQGKDVLVGAEFSCTVPDFNVGIHVLTYGFTQEQEKQLNRLRHNIYNFQRYTKEQNIPTIWAHPLYHYSVKGTPELDFFYKMALIFERFEVLNGQRDTWQNLLVKHWIDQLTPEKIDQLSEKFNIMPDEYCTNPYKKSMSGGSDSHMGIFAGQTGTILQIPNLKKRLKTEKAAELALEAIRNGDMFPYGSHQNSEKLTVAFLDYVCQIAMFQKDPGLMRILLHKGSTWDKILGLIVTNGFAELRRHKVTMQFIELFHKCFSGIQPSASKRLFIPKVYKPVFDEARKIAAVRNLPAEEMAMAYHRSLNAINQELNNVLFSRFSKKINEIIESPSIKEINVNDMIEQMEIPSELRAVISKNSKKKTGSVQPSDIGKFLDGLSFPFLTTSVLLAANFTSSKVMYNARPLLEAFSKDIGKLEHPKRMLWLTDTFEDKNGVSMVLQEMLSEIKKHDLPIDILTCSSTLENDDHLIVVRPKAEFTLPFYKNQPIRIPDFMEIHNLFHENEYDRIMSSTEGIMGIASLYLKQAYTVKAHFFMHTDWLTFARKALQIDRHNLNRVRRVLRAFYKAFDGVFVLNSDHKKWLTGNEIGLNEEDVHLTAHWVDEKFKPRDQQKEELFGLHNNEPVLLYAGRISKEKGVMEIQETYYKIKEQIPNVKLVFAGTGPDEEKLKEDIAEAIFTGWINHDDLPSYYSSADLVILPSRFDTFSVVVLEALSCGTPVIAYNTKGPKDIIQHGESGYLANNKGELNNYAIQYFTKLGQLSYMRKNAAKRAKNYAKNDILNKLLNDVGFEMQIKNKHTCPIAQ